MTTLNRPFNAHYRRVDIKALRNTDNNGIFYIAGITSALSLSGRIGEPIGQKPTG